MVGFEQNFPPDGRELPGRHVVRDGGREVRVGRVGRREDGGRWACRVTGRLGRMAEGAFVVSVKGEQNLEISKDNFTI